MALESIEEKLGNDIVKEQRRFFAIKLLEKDEKLSTQMKQAPDVSEEITRIERELDDDTESIITNERYVYISSIIDECFTRSKKEKLTVSDKIDPGCYQSLFGFTYICSSDVCCILYLCYNGWNLGN